MEKIDEINKAARDIYALLLAHMQKEQGVHIGTLVSTAARLAGTSLLRSFKFLQNQTAPPGTVLLSNEANQEWPKLMNMTLTILKANKVIFDESKMVMKPPAAHAPRTDILQMQAEFQDLYFQIAKKYTLNYTQAAYAGAVTCAMVILKSHTAVDPTITCGIAAMGFVEGSKTAPLPLTDL